MGKKRTRSSQTSKGQRKSLVNGVKEVRQSVSSLEKAMNKVSAWKQGKNPWVTVPGIERNKPWVKRRANEVYGDPRFVANIYKVKGVSDEG